MSTVRIEASSVHDFVVRVLETVGVDTQSNAFVADSLTQASLRGVDSHGIRLLPHYVRAVEGGRINPVAAFDFEQTGASTGRLDADHGFGHAAGMCAMEHAIRMAEDTGSGQVAVINSTHCGAMAYFTLVAAARDMIGFAYTNATPKMRSTNATQTFFGTNPIAMAAPMAAEDPFCLDTATSVMSVNKVRVYADQGVPLPAGCAADANGAETLLPGAAVQMLPIGEYKGFGLAMMVDILCSLLTGMPSGDAVSDMFGMPMSTRRYLGQYYSAVSISAFESPMRFRQRLQETAERIRALPPQREDLRVMIPGDPEKAFAAERARIGIPLHAALVSELRELAGRLGIHPPETAGED